MPEHADGISTGKLIACLETLTECDGLSPMEKETTVRFAKDEPMAHVGSDYGAVVRRLLLHPEFCVVSLRVCGPGDSHPPFGETVEPTDYDGGAVTGVNGTIPIGCLSVRQASRSTKARSNVVSPGVLDNDPREEAEPDA